jgi:hypothetical protein
MTQPTGLVRGGSLHGLGVEKWYWMGASHGYQPARLVKQDEKAGTATLVTNAGLEITVQAAQLSQLTPCLSLNAPLYLDELEEDFSQPGAAGSVLHCLRELHQVRDECLDAALSVTDTIVFA